MTLPATETVQDIPKHRISSAVIVTNPTLETKESIKEARNFSPTPQPVLDVPPLAEKVLDVPPPPEPVLEVPFVPDNPTPPPTLIPDNVTPGVEASAVIDIIATQEKDLEPGTVTTQE